MSSLKTTSLKLSLLILTTLTLSLLKIKEASAEEKAITLYAGYLSRIECDGRLLISAVGNDLIARIEALPKELGCGLLIKPLVSSGQTNLIVETSSQTYEHLLRVAPGSSLPGREALSFRLSGGKR